MVNNTLIRVSVDFKEWVDSQRKITGLKSPVITKVIAGMLRGREIVTVNNRHLVKPRNLTLKKVLETDISEVGDLFSGFKF